jgi:hypothetical protein
MSSREKYAHLHAMKLRSDNVGPSPVQIDWLQATRRQLIQKEVNYLMQAENRRKVYLKTHQISPFPLPLQYTYFVILNMPFRCVIPYTTRRNGIQQVGLQRLDDAMEKVQQLDLMFGSFVSHTGSPLYAEIDILKRRSANAVILSANST